MHHAHNRDHAVVLGAGIAGLPAARVLTETHNAVTVVERAALPALGEINAYLPRLHAAAAHDPTLGEAFVRVLGLVDPPPALLHPHLVRRVLHRPRTTTALSRPEYASADH